MVLAVLSRRLKGLEGALMVRSFSVSSPAAMPYEKKMGPASWPRLNKVVYPPQTLEEKRRPAVSLLNKRITFQFKSIILKVCFLFIAVCLSYDDKYQVPSLEDVVCGLSHSGDDHRRSDSTIGLC